MWGERTGAKAVPAVLVAALVALAVTASAQAETITVNTADDDGDPGDCELREAVMAANTNGVADACEIGDPGPTVDRIEFDIGGGGPQTIALADGALPDLSDPVEIDGTTQGGFAGSPLIEVTGDPGAVAANVFTLAAGSGGSAITGLAINDAVAAAIRIGSDSPGNTIAGNFIGVGLDGTTAAGSANGVLVFTANNVIGGATAAERNVISANVGFGVSVTTDMPGNEIIGNYIGLGADGTTDLGNGAEGISVDNADGTQIGAAGAGNVIANNRAGVRISSTNPVGGVTADDVVVQGNSIGVDADGAPAANSNEGVLIRFGARDSMVGGTGAGEGNLIAHNGFSGVSVADMGIVPDPETDGNAILGNSIHSNSLLGIDLDPVFGVTPNDIGDLDDGANEEQNFPVLAGAQANSVDTTVQGTLSSLPLRTYRIELFSNSSCDGSGNGEGRTFLGAQHVTTTGGGEAQISATVSPSAVGGQLAATATDLTPGETNTSEFSACVEVASKAEPPLASPSLPTNAFDFGKLKRNKKKGIAFLTVILPGPGEVGLEGKGIKEIGAVGLARASRFFSGGEVRLKIRPGKGKQAKRLRERLDAKGKAKLKLRVTFIPTGGTANTLAKKLKLIRK